MTTEPRKGRKEGDEQKNKMDSEQEKIKQLNVFKTKIKNESKDMGGKKFSFWFPASTLQLISLNP